METSYLHGNTRFALKGFPQAVQDQGSRNTCVAFALKAMLEYHLDFSKTVSAQYLYACTHLDGDRAGTTFSEAFECIRKYGACSEEAWPYNPNTGFSESQINCDAVQNIARLELNNAAFAMFKTDPPTGINEYKSVLHGSAERHPSPVLLGIKFFASALTDEGVLRCPVVEDASATMHAVLVYGWCDTPGCVSKGYFMAQNSCGTCGNIKIEYEYIEKYAVAAGALNVPPRGVLPEAPAADAQPVVPSVPESAAGKSNVPEELFSAGALAVKQDFFSSQRNNMKGKYAFPGIKLPFPQNCGAFFYINTQDAFFRHPGNDTPELFQKYLNKRKVEHLAGEVQFFRIQIKKGCYHRLVSAFISNINGGSISSKDIVLLENFVKEYQLGDTTAPRHYFYVIASDCEFDASCESSFDPTMVLCRRSIDKVWSFKLPQAQCGWVTQEFFRHILPGDYEYAVGRALKRISGIINLESIKHELELPAGYDVYDRQLEHALNQIFKNAADNNQPYGINRQRDIWPAGEGLPDGYKHVRYYKKPPMRGKMVWSFWMILTLALIAISILRQLGDKPHTATYAMGSLILAAMMLAVTTLKNKSLQKYKY
ncbi:MAG: hypothetical protein E7047_08495 [Lentisphaerae bacterium]|nr:hypothetical protein [Lentisphaerota bacterium]